LPTQTQCHSKLEQNSLLDNHVVKEKGLNLAKRKSFFPVPSFSGHGVPKYDMILQKKLMGIHDIQGEKNEKQRLGFLEKCNAH
jgi:hypothetical protein